MDRLFDRLGELLRSLLDSGRSSSTYYDEKDPDMRAAFEELDRFLNEAGPDNEQTADSAWWQRFREQGSVSGAGSEDFAGAGGSPGGAGAGGGRSRQAPPPGESLRRDYATLEVSFGASPAEVRRSYKRLLHKYHPDRFSRDEGKQALATEVTQRLNEAFRRIAAFYRK